MPYRDKDGRICGFLDIEGKEGSGHFVRRYFILDPKTNSLQYFMDNPQNLPPNTSQVGSFNMKYVSMVGDGAWARPKVTFSFYITCGRDRRYFKANGADDRDGWIEALKEASRVVVTQRSDSQIDESQGKKTKIVGGVAVKMPLDPSSISDSDSSGDEVDFGGELPTVIQPATQAVPPAVLQAVPHVRVPPIKTGYCIKQGARMKNWKRRYFVLDEDGLSYYKSAEDKAPLRTMCYRDIIEARLSIGIHVNKDNVFEVVTPNRVFYVQAETKEDRDSWMMAVNNYTLARKNPKCLRGMSQEVEIQTDSTVDPQVHKRSRPERMTWVPTSQTQPMAAKIKERLSSN